MFGFFSSLNHRTPNSATIEMLFNSSVCVCTQIDIIIETYSCSVYRLPLSLSTKSIILPHSHSFKHPIVTQPTFHLTKTVFHRFFPTLCLHSIHWMQLNSFSSFILFRCWFFPLHAATFVEQNHFCRFSFQFIYCSLVEYSQLRQFDFQILFN